MFSETQLTCLQCNLKLVILSSFALETNLRYNYNVYYQLPHSVLHMTTGGTKLKGMLIVESNQEILLIFALNCYRTAGLSECLQQSVLIVYFYKSQTEHTLASHSYLSKQTDRAVFKQFDKLTSLRNENFYQYWNCYCVNILTLIMVIKYLICQLKHKTINLAIALVPRWHQSVALQLQLELLWCKGGFSRAVLMAMIYRGGEPGNQTGLLLQRLLNVIVLIRSD